MNLKILPLALFLSFFGSLQAQLIYFKEKIQSPYTIKDEKADKRKQKLISQVNALDTLSYPAQKDDIQAALWSMSQFLLRTSYTDKGIAKLAGEINSLDPSTQRALLEVIYALYPKDFVAEVRSVFNSTSQLRNFGMAAAYLFRESPSKASSLRQTLYSKFPGWRSDELLTALNDYLSSETETTLPPLDSLFAYQQKHGFKVVYSFQRKNRDYPGLAVVQQADGRFARDSAHRLRTFVQLARASSNFPWFLQNGNTPQGVYAITGTEISHNPFIGPTPNLQMVMLGEVNPPQFTHYFPIVFNAPPEKIYRSYLPESWQQWPGLMQAYNAGKIGRSAIIAHGSTIDPEWYRGKSFYPITPTLGCLCGRELWNPKTGKIDYSDQLELVNTFIETAGTKGYAIVIELDDKSAPVSRDEVEAIVNHFENIR